MVEPDVSFYSSWAAVSGSAYNKTTFGPLLTLCLLSL